MRFRRVAGQVYFVGAHYPAGNFYDFMEPFLAELELPAPRRRIPYPVAYGLACVAELLAPRSNSNRFAAVQTCVDHTYSQNRAMREIGFEPLVSLEEAFARTVADLRGQV